MDISTAWAADLAALTESLDEPGTDISQTLRQLAADTKIAVHSYLGLSAILSVGGRRLEFTALEEDAEPEDIRASLRISFPPALSGSEDPAATASLILFAAMPGAFLDLATDLSWLTGSLDGLDTAAFVLDEDLTVPHDPAPPSGLKARSTIDQAIGVLISQGNTPEQAHHHLDLLAAYTRVDQPTAAEAILAEPDQPSTAGLRADDRRPAHTRPQPGADTHQPPQDP
ncbi:ANTAR domain-containing protein [Frankia sp. AiPs1]|uniref:ANTAR domain-containing protein n=1 Tax=Frankia sp. AiPa1 TaxID=573492 RepID=UPI00202B7D97|nr:ANTAR domain-containing protein [Frankia sp. AiPa1]MCL9759647.1 ANTAR domain-containing protein [Frankia sp. AiPa1]